MKKAVLLRFDAASFMGMGHFYQCMTLAEEFKKRSISIYAAVKDYESDVIEQVRNQNIEVLVLPQSCNETEELKLITPFILSKGIDRIIVDDHTIGGEYTRQLKDQDVAIVQIDDEGKREFACDILINYNVYASEIDYKTLPETTCLLGPKFAILRNEFQKPFKRDQHGSRLLVTLGGGFARGEVKKVLQALNTCDDSTLKELQPQIILGPGYPKPDELIKEYRSEYITFYKNPSNMRSIMENCDFAVSSAGGTLYELARVGVPSLIIQLDENQENNAAYFEKTGISQNLGWYEDISPKDIQDALISWKNNTEEIHRRSQKAMALIDGQGVVRVVDHILKDVVSLV